MSVKKLIGSPDHKQTEVRMNFLKRTNILSSKIWSCNRRFLYDTFAPNSSRILDKYHDLFEAQPGVHNIFVHSPQELRVLTTHINPLIPAVIDNVEIKQYLASEFVGAADEFEPNGDSGTTNEDTAREGYTIDQFESVFSNNSFFADWSHQISFHFEMCKSVHDTLL